MNQAKTSSFHRFTLLSLSLAVLFLCRAPQTEASQIIDKIEDTNRHIGQIEEKFSSISRKLEQFVQLGERLEEFSDRLERRRNRQNQTLEKIKEVLRDS